MTARTDKKAVLPAAVLALFASVLFVLGLVFRKQIHERIANLAQRHSRPAGAGTDASEKEADKSGQDAQPSPKQSPDADGPGDYRQDD